MKSVFLLLVCMMTHALTKAQTFDEWFHQKATQEKYLEEQLAALKTYEAVALKGYQLLQQGLTTIGEVRQGELNLHQAFYAGLAIVNLQILFYVQAHPLVTVGNKP